MPPRCRPHEANSTNVNEENEVKGLAGSLENILRGVCDRIQIPNNPRVVKKKEVSDVEALEFKGTKGPLHAHNRITKMERALENVEVLENRKVKTATTFLDESAYHWWVLVSRNNEGAQEMTWEHLKTLFLGQYFGQAYRSRFVRTYPGFPLEILDKPCGTHLKENSTKFLT
ncbi:hypothetical protein ACLB2K_004708 [Fragaria x ananassa]